MFNLVNRLNYRKFSTLLVSNPNGAVGCLPNLLSAGLAFNKDIDILITGVSTDNQIKEIENNHYIHSIRNIFTYESETLKFSNYLLLSNIIDHLLKDKKYENIIMTTSSIGKETIPYISGKHNIMPITEVIKILPNNEFQRPVYAGNIISNVRSKSETNFITIRPTNFEKIKGDKIDLQGLVTKLDYNEDVNCSKYKVLSEDVADKTKADLSSAKFIIGGGRGLKSKENFNLLFDLANKIGDCAVGASRAAVDAGYADNDMQIGQTGKVVAPDVYFAFGISGAIQHVAGIKDSKVIVAVNKDKDAPIFQIADYGLVDDLFKIIPELKEKL